MMPEGTVVFISFVASINDIYSYQCLAHSSDLGESISITDEDTITTDKNNNDQAQEMPLPADCKLHCKTLIVH